MDKKGTRTPSSQTRVDEGPGRNHCGKDMIGFHVLLGRPWYTVDALNIASKEERKPCKFPWFVVDLLAIFGASTVPAFDSDYSHLGWLRPFHVLGLPTLPRDAFVSSVCVPRFLQEVLGNDLKFNLKGAGNHQY